MEELRNEGLIMAELGPLECVLFQNMECRLLIPTPAEYIKLLLFFANHERSFEDLISRANNISLTSMLVYEIS